MSKPRDLVAPLDETPLPSALPYHVADPTTSSLEKLSARDLLDGDDRAALDDPDDLTAELETRQRRRIDPHEIDLISQSPTTVPFERIEVDVDDDAEDEDERTQPRELPMTGRSRSPSQAMLLGAFFAPLPSAQRAAVLARFQRRTVAAGTTVIRQGETSHPLVLVAKGRLDVRVERAGRPPVQVGTIASREYVGEAALLARGPAPAHVVAATDAELLELAPREFYELAGMFPALWAELKDVAERRTREHDQRLRGR